ncbi:MAG: DUF4956 domain-containing protein, partial [Patescibacteria group bacterium]
VYKKTFRGNSYSASFILSLVILPLISSLVLLAIGSNLARAFGLVGTLAIIRFRTPLKDPKDLVFVFFSLVVGIISGTQNYHIAFIGAPLVLLAMYLLDKYNFGNFTNSSYFLTFKVKKETFNQSTLGDILAMTCQDYRLNSLEPIYEQADFFRVVYKISLLKKENEQELIAKLTELNTLNNITLVSSENYSEY